jgi:hypothetical protein
MNASAFKNTKLKSIEIEAGNDIFHVEHEFLINIVHHKLIRNFSVSSKIEIPQTIEIVGSSCFSRFPSLSSISFESNPGLKRIEARALFGTSVLSVVISSMVYFIASTAFDPECQISLLDDRSCPEFEQWSAVRGWDSNINFRRIQKLGSGLHNLSDCVVDLSECERGDEIDGLEIFVKLFGEFDQDEYCEIEREIKKLMNLTHPCIAVPFRFVPPTASKELRVARLYTRSDSLKDVLSADPLW